MNRGIRNRLASLLLGAFDNPAQRDAVLWLALFFELCSDRRPPQISVPDLEAAWIARHPEAAPCGGSARGVPVGLEGLIQVQAGAGTRGSHGHVSERPGVPWYEPHPEMLSWVAHVRERVRVYADVVRRGVGGGQPFARLEPPRRRVAEAAVCFNAGLFFEAHEHLEGYWRDLAPSPAKRFMQGLIQISVGFHHAMRGSYQGAVNQLGKGLTKLGEAPEGALGLDRDRLARDVEATRQAIVSRGRNNMRKATLEELPRMHFRR